MKGTRLIAIVGGFALDALVGDPHGWPHPVRLIGKHIELEERIARDYIIVPAGQAGDAWPLTHEQTERLAGAAVAADVALAAPLATFAVLKLCGKAHPALAVAAETFICYQLLAARALRDESMAVHDALARGDVDGARANVSLIVGRDTDCLDEAGIARAAVETIAENTSDGVVAPLLFMGVGGAPGAMFYKAVNTLDSMIGYRNDRYLNVGRTAARLDDIVNFIPARVSGVLMCAAAALSGFDAKRAWRTFKRDRLKHSSPNSAHTEAACAGALGVQLGGPNRYFGKLVDKPAIGDDCRAVEADDIERANTLMYATAALGLAAAVGIGCAAGGLGALVRSRFGKGR